MNLMLHDIGGDKVRGGDTLGSDGETLGKADLILTNPPFGTKKGGGRPMRSDFTITADTSNKQLAFVEHIVRALKPGGRASVVLPDNVLFADGAGRELRSWLMDLCDLHTILRLPTGIFYAQGIKTNVLFFRRGKTDKANTQAVWVYDLRAGQPAYGKTRPLQREDFAEFEAAYGNAPNGTATREDQGLDGRFRCFTRAELLTRGDNLDISWLRGSDEAGEDSLEDPEDIAELIKEHLQRALTEIDNAVLARKHRNQALINIFAQNAWPKKSLAQITDNMFDGPFGSHLKSSDYTDAGVRVVRLENIGHLHFVREKETFVSDQKAMHLARHKLQPDDILFSSFVDKEIRVCIVPGDLPTDAINKADCFCLRVNKEAYIPEFIAYCLASPTTYEHMRDAVHGATRPRIGLTDLKRYQIPAPNIEIQRAVVQNLRMVYHRTHTAEREASRAIALLDRFKKSILGELIPQGTADEKTGGTPDSIRKIIPEFQHHTNSSKITQLGLIPA